MSDDKMTKDDLFLLMESYKNMITMHQTILDQTSKTITKLDNIANKQDNLFSKQGQICNTLKTVANRIDDYADNLSFILNKLNAHENKTIEQHSKVVNKIHLGWIGMGTIIMGLIGLVISLMQTT